MSLPVWVSEGSKGAPPLSSRVCLFPVCVTVNYYTTHARPAVVDIHRQGEAHVTVNTFAVKTRRESDCGLHAQISSAASLHELSPDYELAPR